MVFFFPFGAWQPLVTFHFHVWKRATCAFFKASLFVLHRRNKVMRFWIINQTFWLSYFVYYSVNLHQWCSQPYLILPVFEFFSPLNPWFCLQKRLARFPSESEFSYMSSLFDKMSWIIQKQTRFVSRARCQSQRCTGWTTTSSTVRWSLCAHGNTDLGCFLALHPQSRSLDVTHKLWGKPPCAGAMDQTSRPQRVFAPHTDIRESVCDRDHMELLGEFVILPSFPHASW